MSDKTISLILFGIIVILFSIYTITHIVLFDSGNLILEPLNRITDAVKNEEWNKAEKIAAELNIEWDKRKYFVMLNYAEEDYSTFEDTLIRLESAVRMKDAQQAVI